MALTVRSGRSSATVSTRPMPRLRSTQTDDRIPAYRHRGLPGHQCVLASDSGREFTSGSTARRENPKPTATNRWSETLSLKALLLSYAAHGYQFSTGGFAHQRSARTIPLGRKRFVHGRPWRGWAGQQAEVGPSPQGPSVLRRRSRWGCGSHLGGAGALAVGAARAAR
jgi:hypothetical protein